VTKQKATNVHWHDGEISQINRNNLLGQKGATLWFTGLSGSGKSTVAVALEQELFKRGKLSYRLDGDNIRLGINKNLGFSAEDRTENIRRIGEIAKLFVDCGVLCLSSFISPYIEDRNAVRKLHEESGMLFIEIFVDCTLDVAESRDPKGLYKKARLGEIKNFTGIDDPYEAPVEPEVHLETNIMDINEEVAKIIDYLSRIEVV
jgi:adenylylsulfate kinase